MSSIVWLLCCAMITLHSVEGSTASLFVPESPRWIELPPIIGSPITTVESAVDSSITLDSVDTPMTPNEQFEDILRRAKYRIVPNHHHAKNLTQTLLTNGRSHHKMGRSKSFSYTPLSDFYAQKDEHKAVQQTRLARKFGNKVSTEMEKQRKRPKHKSSAKERSQKSLSELTTAIKALWPNSNNITMESIQRLMESNQRRTHTLSTPIVDATKATGSSARFPILTPNSSFTPPMLVRNSTRSLRHAFYEADASFHRKKRKKSRSEYYTERSDKLYKSPQRQHSYSLLSQYWWLIVIITCVIMTLVAITCTLGYKQYRFHITEKQKAIEAKMNEQHKHNTNMQSRSKRHRHSHMTRIEIETTDSDQAPCNAWMLCDQIGSGRFGDVRLAIDPQVQYRSSESVSNDDVVTKPKFYAVKRAKCFENKSSSTLCGTEAFSIFQEILILSKLKHPNIVRYYGNGGANQYICLFLEWCPAGSMSDVLRVRKSFNIPRIHHYLSQLLSAIDYLHSMQIYHRDIKARNILLCSGGICKLADFGSSVDVHQIHTANKQQLSVAGTVHWWAPETFLDSEQHIDILAAHDVWSLGVTLIEMIRELPLFHQLSVEAFSIMMKTTPMQYLEQLPVTTDVNLNMFMKCCLTIDYKQRRDIKQLLQLPFIVSGPQQQDIRYNSAGISAFLRNREKEAKKYAASIMNSNLERWIASNADSHYGCITPPTSNADHSCILKLQPHKIQINSG